MKAFDYRQQPLGAVLDGQIEVPLWEEAAHEEIAHLRFPQMLYTAESLVFTAGFVWSMLFLLAPAGTSVYGARVVYAISMVAITSLIVAMVSAKIAMALKKFRENTYKPKEKSNANMHSTEFDLYKAKAGLELDLDLMRYGASLVAGPFVILLLMNMLLSGETKIVGGKGLVVLMWEVAILFATYTKLYAFDMQVQLAPKQMMLGVVVPMCVTAGLVIWLLVDLLLSADEDSPMKTNIYFVVLTTICGYAVPYLYVNYTRKKELDKPKVRSVGTDTFKHVCHVAIDVLAIGFLVFGTLFEAYGQPFKGTQFFLYESDFSPPPPPAP